MTYNEIIYDIMELIRGQQLSDDTDLSEKQIAFHLHNQRALWLRNEFNKPGRKIDQQVVQDLGCLELEEVDAAECCNITSGCIALRTKKKLPKFIELHNDIAITRVGPVNKLKKGYNFTSYNQAVVHAHNKYGKKEIVAFWLNDRIYLIIEDMAYQNLEYINVQGVPANPEDLKDYKCDVSGEACFSYDDTYPINNWMYPYIKEQILGQLGMTLQIPKDTANDAKEDLNKQ